MLRFPTSQWLKLFWLPRRRTRQHFSYESNRSTVSNRGHRGTVGGAPTMGAGPAPGRRLLHDPGPGIRNRRAQPLPHSVDTGGGVGADFRPA